ncbi:MAG: helix-turn-helix domain-containing protein [bacterium]|nr:helix-turn-helix domain-containing protein [bacterium]
MYFLSKNIKYLRKIKEITQKDFSVILNMSLDTIKSIETERITPSLETLIKIRNYFNVNLDDLIFIDLENKS